MDLDGGGIRIQYGPREVLVNNEKRTVRGNQITIQGSRVVEMTSSVRFEPKVRPSVARLTEKNKAAELAQKLVGTSTPSAR